MRPAVRNDLYLAMTRDTTFLGLPYFYGLCVIVIGIFPFIWLQSLWVLIFVVVVYVVLRVAAEKDDKALEAFMKGSSAVPPTQSKKIYGGDSFGP